MPRQRRPSQYQPRGPKLSQVQNLGGCFVVFFLGGQNRNFEKVRGLKLQLSLNYSNIIKKMVPSKSTKFIRSCDDTSVKNHQFTT